MRRKAMGLSQEEVARRLHITRQTLSKWENGLSVPDAQLLQQALNNLISNAILHSGTKRIELSAVREGDRQIDFRVRDWGRGIPEEHRELIFRRFYRVPGGSRNCGGSGIGLAIVKHGALYHRGRVGVESPPGGGAEFHIVLPV